MRHYSISEWFKDMISDCNERIEQSKVICDCECRVISEEPIPIEEITNG